MTRFLNGTYIKDQISTKTILNRLDLLSVNQMNPQIKLTEGWKISNIDNYPTKWALKSTTEDERTTRATSSNKVHESAKSKTTQSAFNNDAKNCETKLPRALKRAPHYKWLKKQ